MPLSREHRAGIKSLDPIPGKGGDTYCRYKLIAELYPDPESAHLRHDSFEADFREQIKGDRDNSAKRFSPITRFSHDRVFYLLAHPRCHHSLGGFSSAWPPSSPLGDVRIIAANPGTLVFPTCDMPFPYGFGDLPNKLGRNNAIRDYLAAPLTLFLGTADTGSENLDQSKESMMQGATRVERTMS